MTTTSDILGVLARADKRWADRRELAPAEGDYLETLAAAVRAHVAGKQTYHNTHLRALLAGVLLDTYDPDGDLVEQAEEAVRIVQKVHRFLLDLRSAVRRPERMEGAA